MEEERVWWWAGWGTETPEKLVFQTPTGEKVEIPVGSTLVKTDEETKK